MYEGDAEEFSAKEDGGVNGRARRRRDRMRMS